ncbi:MAG TPA: phage tail assembly protein [Rhodopila sp.]|jgi:hypothetical protein|nr:phage tail assembly protein [Rhodopila sp.]
MENLEKTTTIFLDDPIKFNGGEYSQLELREHTIGEWKKAETHRTATTHFIQLISSVSGWPVPAVEQLPQSKFDEAVLFLQGFMKRGPATGEI